MNLTANTLDDLPVWDLSDLYPGMDSPELGADIKCAEEAAAKFAKTYRKQVAKLGREGLNGAVAEYESISELLGRITSYAQLVHAANINDPEIGRFYQTIRERVTDISSQTLFFTIEINSLEDNHIEKCIEGPASRYLPWFRNVRAFRPHQLSEDLERLLHEKQTAGSAAWMRLFDETIADMRFDVQGDRIAIEEALDLLSDPDSCRREQAALAIGDELARHGRVFSLISNTLARDKEIEDQWRRFPEPQSARNLDNQVEDEVVDALNQAVRNVFPDISHRYYRMKAEWMGKPHLKYWDRNAPLPGADNAVIPWDQARDTVLAAYGGFSEEMADLGRCFFDNAWIDAAMRPDKAPGAFAHPTVPSAHPYLLLNYRGKTRDVMVLAHELGHGVHQLLAADQGALLADTPLTLAETASVFGEMLTFRRMLDAETSPTRLRIMLASKVEDMINTVIRQIAFYNFELRLHTARRGGELTGDEICEIWMAVQKESLGDAFDLDESYRWYWTYIPHFIHSPFYVYAYAFGDCLVNSLYALYQNAEEGFVEKYLSMLRAGGSLRHRELLRTFGLDASEPEFWQQGLGVVSGFVDELESLADS